MDAEMNEVSEGAREAIWLKTILSELQIIVRQIQIYCDSRCAISIFENPENPNRVKHIDVKYFFIREQQDQGTIALLNVSTVNQLIN